MKGLRWVVRDDFIEWGSFSTVVDERIGIPSEGTVSVTAGPQAEQWMNSERRTVVRSSLRTGNDRQVGHK